MFNSIACETVPGRSAGCAEARRGRWLACLPLGSIASACSGVLQAALVAAQYLSAVSAPFLVKISRDGEEIGIYDSKEAIRLLLNGSLKVTDLYWREGMIDWAPLGKLQVSDALERIELKKEHEEAVKLRLAEDLEKGVRRAQVICGAVLFFFGILTIHPEWTGHSVLATLIGLGVSVAGLVQKK